MASNGADQNAEVQRLAAYRALKALFARLVSDISPDAICDMLYANSVIGRDELQIEHQPNKKRTRRLILALQKAVQDDHTLFDKFCSFLENEGDVGLSENAKRLRGMIQVKGRIQALVLSVVLVDREISRGG